MVIQSVHGHGPVRDGRHADSGAATPASVRPAQRRAADASASVTSLLGAFDSAKAAPPVQDPPPSAASDSDEGVTGLLGAFAPAETKKGTAGALAVDAAQGARWGWAIKYATMKEAEQRALAKCGEGCRIIMRFDQGCAAYAADQAEGSTAAGWTYGLESAGQVQTGALSNCTERGGTDCIVRVWACT